MKKITLFVLVAALLGVAGAAFAEGTAYFEYYGEAHKHYYPPAKHYHHALKHYVYIPCPYIDMRIKRAEAEKLKAEYHYYAMSGHACDVATAKLLRAELSSVLAEIDAWYGGR